MVLSFFGKKRGRKNTEERAGRLIEAIRALSVDEGERVSRLEQRRLEIVGRVKQAPRLEQLMTDELGKLEKLTDDFLQLQVTLARYESVLRQSPPGDLEAELRRAEDNASRSLDESTRELAKMNVEVLRRRQGKMTDMRQHVGRIRVQLDLIENTFKLVADDVRELEATHREGDGTGSIGRQLDELTRGVALVRSIEQDRRDMLGDDREPRDEG